MQNNMSGWEVPVGADLCAEFSPLCLLCTCWRIFPPVLRGVSRMIPRREGGWTGLLHSTSCLNKSHVIRGNKMTITNPVETGCADDCKHRDSTQYWEQSKTSINICWVSEWRIFGLCFTSDGLFWYVQEPRVHLLFCICETYQRIAVEL